MFNVYCDGTLIYDLYADGLVLVDPVLELELNSPGTFEFSMTSDHPYYDLPQRMLSRITVTQDGTEIFCGRVIEETVDFYKTKTLYCEGELAFLNDSIQRPAEYHDMSVRDYFKTLIDCHNEQVEADKQFEIGIVTVSDDNDSVFRYTNYNSTMEEMKEDLIDDFGGYIRVRNENGRRYLDYIGDINDYGARNDNAIRFGTNLLDYSQDTDSSEIATVIIPLGERLEESPIEALDMRLTIESVNGGSDAIESTEAVETYGRIVQTVIWDDVTVASNLLEKGKKYLSDYQFDNMVLEVSAVDLNLINADIETSHLGDMLRVVSSPHGLDRYFPLSQETLHLDSTSENSYTLGSETTEKTLTSRVVGTSASIAAVEEEITPTQVILNQAKEQATNLITAATHGYVVMQPNDSPNEILIMDTADTTTAKRLWRWNLNGLGYSSSGYNGSYGTAITMDGAIVADYITTGTLTANVIRAGTLQDTKKNNYWDLDSGVLVIKSKCLTLDANGNATFSGTLSAASGSFSGQITATSGYIGGTSGWTIASSGIYKGITSPTSSSGRGVYHATDMSVWQDSSTNRVEISNVGEINIRYGSYYTNFTGSTWRLYSSSGTTLFELGTGDLYKYTSSGGTQFGVNSGSRRVQIGANYSLYVQGDISTDGYVYALNMYSTIVDGYLSDDQETLTLSAQNRTITAEDADKFFDGLKPALLRKDAESNEHLGLTYKDTVKALEDAGIDPEDTDITKEEDDPETGEKGGAVSVDEIVTLLVYEVQSLKEEIKQLKEQHAN